MVEVLKTSCSHGRLTLDEFSERVQAAYQAVSLGDLPLLLGDLPHPFGPDLSGLLSEDIVNSAPQTLVFDSNTRKATRWTISIMGGSQRRGRWRLREKTNAVAIMGGCVLDLRNSEVEGPEVVVNAIAVMGGIEIIVPEGIEVELGGIAIMGGKDARQLKRVRSIPGSPIVRVKVFAFWGGVSVRSKPAHVEQLGDAAHEPLRNLEPPIGFGSSLSKASRHPGLIDLAAEAPAMVDDNLKPGGLPEGTVTIMFSDIEGFTSTTERIGDRRAMEILREHNGIIRQRIASSGGHEVKSQGDGFMVAFSGASRALECAVGIQTDLAARNRSNPEITLQVRLGLHAGEAIRDGNDYLGGAVMLAARITQAANGGEILVSSVLKELCDLSGEFEFGDGRDIYLKGLSEQRRVYSVRWQGL